MSRRPKYDYTFETGTHEFILSNFDYCEETGTVRRKDGYRGVLMRTPRGHSLAFHPINVDGRQVALYSHHIIWSLLGRDLASNEILSHCNRDGLNNRPANLCAKTHSQKQASMAVAEHKKSGLPKGVTYWPARRKYRAHIRVDGELTYAGISACPAVASFMYQIAADKIHGNLATPGF